MAKIYKNAAELVGNTPLLEVGNIEKNLGLEAKVLVKLEYFNPAGSAKDRIALSMIEDAEEKGVLKPGAVIIEPTSGNTGIGLASLAAIKGYKVILSTFSYKKALPANWQSRDPVNYWLKYTRPGMALKCYPY